MIKNVEILPRRYSKSYTSKIILNTDYLNNHVKLLKSNYFIGIALDVHAKGKTEI